MRKYLAGAVALFFFFPCNAQTVAAPKQNSLLFELGKNGLLYNLTFDRTFKSKRFGFRLGIGSNFGRWLEAHTVGGGVYGLVGKNRDFFEAGVDVQYLQVSEVSDDQRGLVLLYPDDAMKAVYSSVNLGFRHCGNHTLFRVGFSPGLIERHFVAGGYVGFGIRF